MVFLAGLVAVYGLRSSVTSQGIEGKVTITFSGGAPPAGIWASRSKTVSHTSPVRDSLLEVRKLPQGKESVLPNTSTGGATMGEIPLPSSSPLLAFPLAATSTTDTDGHFRAYLESGRYIVLLKSDNTLSFLNSATSGSNGQVVTGGVIDVRQGQFTTVGFNLVALVP
jgi:hypothetical protein